MTGIQSSNGGWMSLGDFCNSKSNGSGLHYLNINDDELNVLELGARVTNYIAQFECDGWDALMDMSYEEHCRDDE